MANSDPVRKLLTLFQLLDGTPKPYDAVEDAVDALYSRDVKMSGIDEEVIGFDRIVQAVTDLCQEGVRCEVQYLKKTETGVNYEIVYHFPDGDTFAPKTKATFKDGLCVNLVPLDPTQIEEIISKRDL